MSSFICELQSFKCILFVCQTVKQCNKDGSQKYNKVIQDLQLHSIASLKKKKRCLRHLGASTFRGDSQVWETSSMVDISQIPVRCQGLNTVAWFLKKWLSLSQD